MYSEYCQTPKIERFAKVLNGFRKTLYLRCFARILIRKFEILFANLPVPAKHEFYLASSLSKFGQIPKSQYSKIKYTYDSFFKNRISARIFFLGFSKEA